MNPITRSSDKLAALGGTPVLKSMPSMKWPAIDRATERALADIYRSRAWSWNGPWEQKFCRDFAKAHTAHTAIFMANGTVTLEAALHVLGIGRGDEVIVPALTWLASAMAVAYVGAKPVFVDIEPDTLCLDPVKVVEAITPRTRAIMPVHLYGGMADMDRIMAIARQHDLKVIEDCAHGHGGIWNGRGLGSIGDIGSFSFQQSKTIACGEGGAVITRHARLVDRLFRFKHIGYDAGALQGKASGKPPAGLVCHNYRGLEFQTAILHGQLRHLRALTTRRNRTTAWLTRELEKIPGVRVQSKGRRADAQSYYAYVVILDFDQWAGATKDQVSQALRAENVPAGGTYGSVYHHLLWNLPPSAYRIHGGWRDHRGPGCRVSEQIGTDRAFAFIHWWLDLPRPDLERIVAAFAKVQQNAAALRQIKVKK